MKILRPILLVVLSVVCAGTVHAADDVSASEKKKILELMDIIGAKNIGRQVSVSFAQQLSYGLKQSQPDIDPQAFKVVAAVTDEELSKHADELTAKMIPLYAKHFTEPDLDALLAFYRSPIGRKTVEAMPALMQESMELAIDESKASVPKIQERVTEKLRADGILKDKK
jgi:uncharacterized protein